MLRKWKYVNMPVDVLSVDVCPETGKKRELLLSKALTLSIVPEK
jgi:hypothetical protein